MALVSDSFPSTRDHRFPGLASADIVAFHLPLQQQQLLLGSFWLGGRCFLFGCVVSTCEVIGMWLNIKGQKINTKKYTNVSQTSTDYIKVCEALCEAPLLDTATFYIVLSNNQVKY